VAAGSVFQLLPGQVVHAAAGLGFLAFAVVALRRKEEELLVEEEEEVAKAGRRHWPPWVTSFLMVFAAEWGDLTQLATAALVAQTRDPLPVAIGATAALWTVTVIAVVAGSQIGRYLKQGLLNRISAALFAIVGLFMLGSALIGS
jgi:Ca2+/H+ antiporter, TMEM165/GDT1 family